MHHRFHAYLSFVLLPWRHYFVYKWCFLMVRFRLFFSGFFFPGPLQAVVGDAGCFYLFRIHAKSKYECQMNKSSHIHDAAFIYKTQL